MKDLLDTNICSAHMRRPAQLAHRFVQYIGQLAIPTIVLGELFAGAYKHPDPARLLALIADLQRELHVLDYDVASAEEFGRLRGASLRRGRPGSSIDLQIASVAKVHDLTLVTHNTRDFVEIDGLRLEDWPKP